MRKTKRVDRRERIRAGLRLVCRWEVSGSVEEATERERERRRGTKKRRGKPTRIPISDPFRTRGPRLNYCTEYLCERYCTVLCTVLLLLNAQRRRRKKSVIPKSCRNSSLKETKEEKDGRGGPSFCAQTANVRPADGDIVVSRESQSWRWKASAKRADSATKMKQRTGYVECWMAG